MSARTDELKAAIVLTEKQVAPYLSLLQAQRDMLRKTTALEFIDANEIKRADVEDPDEPGRPYFHTLDRWIQWLRMNSAKNWAAWNGRIYRMSDLKADRWPETPAILDDLKA